VSLAVFGSTTLRIEYARLITSFFLKLKDLRIESEPFTGRVYFIDNVHAASHAKREPNLARHFHSHSPPGQKMPPSDTPG
jgi:hypothetical protein